MKTFSGVLLLEQAEWHGIVRMCDGDNSRHFLRGNRTVHFDELAIGMRLSSVRKWTTVLKRGRNWKRRGGHGPLSRIHMSENFRNFSKPTGRSVNYFSLCHIPPRSQRYGPLGSDIYMTGISNGEKIPAYAKARPSAAARRVLGFR